MIPVLAGAASRQFTAWAILCVVVALVVSFGAGYHNGWSKRGDREAALRLEERERLDAAVVEERRRANAIAADLEAEKRNIKTITIEVIKEVPRVTKVYVEKPGEAPKPIPDAVYTHGFVRLWDKALGSGVPRAAGEFDSAAGESDIARADVTSADILENHAINAEKYASCRAQLNSLIDFVEGRTKATK